MRRSLDEHARLAAAFPDDVRFTRERALDSWLLATIYSGIGDNWDWSASTGDVAAGERFAREAVEIATRITDRDRTDVRSFDDEGTMRSTLAALIAERDPREAVEEFERALALWKQVPPSKLATHYSIVLAFYASCAEAVPLARVGRARESRERTSEGLALLAHEPADSVVEERAICTYPRARADHALGDDASAVREIDEVIAALQPMIEAKRTLKISNYIGLVKALELRAQAAPEQACASRARAKAVWSTWPRASAFTKRVTTHLDAASRGCSPAP
jgi:hypothetical protein